MTLLDLVSDIQLYKKQSANCLEGPCPKCKSPWRMIIWKNKDIFKCLACEFKGDTFKWLREVEGYSCREAHVALGRQCTTTGCSHYAKCSGDTTPRRRKPGSATPPVGKQGDWQPREAEAPEVLWQQKARELVDWAHQELLGNAEMLAYLADRGLPLEAVQKNRLGWNPGQESKGKKQPLFKQRSAWGLPDKVNDETGKVTKVLAIQRGLVIPSFSGEDVYRLRIRRTDEDLAAYTGPEDKRPPKYLFLEGSGKGLVIRNPAARAFVIVESDLDDLLLDFVAGDLICSVALTSCGIRPDADSAPIFSRAACLLVALDYDPRANKRTGCHESPGGQASRWWLQHFPQSERWPPPVGKDPGEAFKEGADLRQWVIDGLPVSLKPRQVDKKQEVPKVSFNQQKMLQLMTDARGRVEAACPAGAMDWLATQELIWGHLKAADRAVDAAFGSEDEQAVTKTLEAWEKYYMAAWQRYRERPQVIDVENDAKGDSNA